VAFQKPFTTKKIGALFFDWLILSC